MVLVRLEELLGKILHWTWLLPLPPGNGRHVLDDDDVPVEVEQGVVVGKVARATLSAVFAFIDVDVVHAV